jgi:hypothetical protein
MNAAVVRSTYKQADLDRVIKQYKETVLPAIAAHQGGSSAIFLVDRQSGTAISMAMYEDAASAAAFAPKAQQLIESFKQFRTSEEPKRELFEVAATTQQEAKAVVERLLKSINDKDLEEAARLTAPDSVLTAPGGVTAKGATGDQGVQQELDHRISRREDRDTGNLCAGQPGRGEGAIRRNAQRDPQDPDG